jgi:ATP-dependent Clp protease ATP-binding subunit ClpC
LIADIMLKDLFQRLTVKGIHLEVTEKFKDRLIEEGYNPAYGARPLRRAIMRLLEDILAEEMLSGRLSDGDSGVVDLDEENKAFVKIQPTVLGATATLPESPVDSPVAVGE